MANISTLDLLNGIGKVNTPAVEKSKPENGESFADTLKNTINQLNDIQINKENALTDIATGQVKNLHQAAMAIDKAEISMKLALEIRNKAVQAYKELMKTQV